MLTADIVRASNSSQAVTYFYSRIKVHTVGFILYNDVHIRTIYMSCVVWSCVVLASRGLILSLGVLTMSISNEGRDFELYRTAPIRSPNSA